MNSRRHFIKKILRIFMLGGLIKFVLSKSDNGQNFVKNNQSCSNKLGYCRKCPVLAKCLHPTAISFKQQG
ncbi:MAG: hypothetical protein ACRC37_04745 [Lentisphaeria bacterium]